MVGRATFLVGRQSATIVVMHLHVETARTPRHDLADTAHTDNAEALAGDLLAHHERRAPAIPVAAAHQGVAFGRAPCRTEQ